MVEAHSRAHSTDSRKKTAVNNVDIVPDWIIAVLAASAVAGTFWIFGGLGVFVLGVTSAAVWIAQTFRGQ
jgi:hypothetical protein